MAGRGSYYNGYNRVQAESSNSCILEYDGASKGNPGRSGAGFILRGGDGSELYRGRKGLGYATNNQAEYQALILGMRFALDKGFEHIQVRGDSELVTKQVQGEWQARNPNMAYLRDEALGLISQFKSFDMQHVPREYNYDADVEANRATNLRDGEFQIDQM